MVYRRGQLDNPKGYDARLAARLLAQNPNLSHVVVSHDAPTRSGYRIVQTSTVLYYRKSTGGSWARSSQRLAVVSAEIDREIEVARDWCEEHGFGRPSPAEAMERFAEAGREARV
jgi:hypothetical protein